MLPRHWQRHRQDRPLKGVPTNPRVSATPSGTFGTSVATSGGHPRDARSETIATARQDPSLPPGRLVLGAKAGRSCAGVRGVSYRQ